jgi:enamine deaminase RidA (YjgF/YER057c/UK114 family)
MSPPATWAVKAGRLIFFGATAPLGDSGEFVAPGDVAAQTERIIERYEEALDTLGLGLTHLCSVTVHLDAQADEEAMSAAYRATVPSPYPACAVVRVPSMPPGMMVEMTAVASLEKKTAL